MPLSAGDTLGRYELLAPIGKGGMGEVWRARDPHLNREVAVKTSLVGLGRFQQEARAIAALNHPHICQIYDVGPDYLVMEFIDGQPLSDLIKAGPVPLRSALRIVSQIANAVEAAHKRGILHRDLKPGNVLVTEAGAKLLDFGLAKLATEGDDDATRTRDGAVLGTAAYMSPEQAQGKPLDNRSDIFSFGAILYEMLSGKRAFPGASMAEVLSAVIRDEPTALDSPASVIVKRCLEKDPRDRYASMLAVKDALEEITSHSAPSQQAARRPSIAVLPFANMSRDPDDEYFSDGLADEIISLLAKIPDLKVIARTSAFAFRGKEQDIRGIAGALGVNTILEGSVRRAGNRLRVTAQLISAVDGSHLFSERYDREMADVFALQDDLATAITTVLRVKLAIQPANRREYKPGIPGYEAVLKARSHFYKLTPSSMARSRELLGEAIALEPGYALAHAELALNLSASAGLGAMGAHDAMPLARASASRALEIEPTNQEGLTVLGTAAAFYNYEWEEAERLFHLAKAQGRMSPLVLGRYARYLCAVGRRQEAIDHYGEALVDDPLNLYLRVSLASALLPVRSEDASAECRHVLELDENYYLAWHVLSFASLHQGRTDEALDAAERVASLAPWFPGGQGVLAALLALRGEEEKSLAPLARLGDGSATDAPYGFYLYFVLLEQVDQAADWAARAIAQRSPILVIAFTDPWAQSLRRSPRWSELARMMNLPINR